MKKTLLSLTLITLSSFTPTLFAMQNNHQPTVLANSEHIATLTSYPHTKNQKMQIVKLNTDLTSAKITGINRMTLTVDVKEDIYKIHKTKIYNYNWDTPIVNDELILLTAILKTAMLSPTNYNFIIYSAGIVGPDATRGFTAALYAQQSLPEITRRDYETRSWLLPNDWYIARVSYKIFFNAELN